MDPKRQIQEMEEKLKTLKAKYENFEILKSRSTRQCIERVTLDFEPHYRDGSATVKTLANEPSFVKKLEVLLTQYYLELRKELFEQEKGITDGSGNE